jgi:hypothetical protein
VLFRLQLDDSPPRPALARKAAGLNLMSVSLFIDLACIFRRARLMRQPIMIGLRAQQSKCGLSTAFKGSLYRFIHSSELRQVGRGDSNSDWGRIKTNQDGRANGSSSQCEGLVYLLSRRQRFLDRKLNQQEGQDCR